MSDLIQDLGYFGYYPFENMRERNRGLSLNSSSFPITFSTLVKNKVDFVLIRAGVDDSSGLPTFDSAIHNGSTFITTNIADFYNHGIPIGFYWEYKPWKQAVKWSDTTAGDELGQALQFFKRYTDSFTPQIIPILSFETDGTLTSTATSTLLNYVNNIVTRIQTYVDITDVIIKTNQTTFALFTSNTTFANSYRYLHLNGAYGSEYYTGAGTTTYPATAFTIFGGYTNFTLCSYSKTSNSLGSTYGLNTTDAELVIIDDRDVQHAFIGNFNIDKEYLVGVLDYNFTLKGYMSNKSNKVNYDIVRTVQNDGKDIIEGRVFKTDLLYNYITGNSNLIYIDMYNKYNIYNLVTVSDNPTDKTFTGEAISNYLYTDIITSNTIGTTSKSISGHLTDILSSSNSTNNSWQLGDVTGFLSSDTRKLLLKDKTTLRYLNIIEALGIVAKTFNCWFNFRIVVNEDENKQDGDFIQGLYIDVFNNIGRTDNGLVYSDTSNVFDFELVTENRDYYTAIVPYSDNVASATWYAYSNTSGNYVKDANSYIVYDNSLTGKYAIGGTESIVGTESFNEADTSALLFGYAIQWLAERNKFSESFQVEAVVSLDDATQFPKVGDNGYILNSSIIKNEKTTFTKIRYIKHTMKGSDVDALSYINEISAYDYNGLNKALGKTVTGSAGSPYSGSYSNVVDGDITTYVVPASSGEVWVKIDLGQLEEIDYINVLHKYDDGRKFIHKTEVSADDSTYFTIGNFESAENPYNQFGTPLNMPYSYNVVFHVASNSTLYRNYMSADTPIVIKVNYYPPTPNRYDVGTIATGNGIHYIASSTTGSTILTVPFTAPYTYQMGQYFWSDHPLYGTASNGYSTLLFEGFEGNAYEETSSGKNLNVPFDLINNVTDYTYRSYDYNVGISQVKYNIERPKIVTVNLGTLQKNIIDTIGGK